MALAAAGAAVVALLLAVYLAVRLRSLRRSQMAVLGEERRDLVTHSAQLDAAFADLREYVEEALARLEQRAVTMDGRIDDALAYRAIQHTEILFHLPEIAQQPARRRRHLQKAILHLSIIQ